MKSHVKAHSTSALVLSAAVLARAVALDPAASLTEFVYLPAGEHEIHATVNGKPKKITVRVDAAAADRLQADLTERVESGISPFFDYDHEAKRSSGLPLEFYWKEGVGVMCKVAWTAPATAAIRAGEWRYFSPEFRYDTTAKTVAGLMAAGPLGGLVNDPAFRAMPAVQARRDNTLTDPDEGPEPTQQPNPKKTMNIKIVAALAAVGILSETEAASDQAHQLITDRVKALREGESVKAAHNAALEEKDKLIAEQEKTITELRAHAANVAKVAAKNAVEAAVKAGRIGAKDEGTRKFWESAIERDGESAITALNAIEVKAALNPVRVSSQEGGAQGGEEVKAKQGRPEMKESEFDALSVEEKCIFTGVKGGNIIPD